MNKLMAPLAAALIALAGCSASEQNNQTGQDNFGAANDPTGVTASPAERDNRAMQAGTGLSALADIERALPTAAWGDAACSEVMRFQADRTVSVIGAAGGRGTWTLRQEGNRNLVETEVNGARRTAQVDQVAGGELRMTLQGPGGAATPLRRC